jgi:hypothetical protein
VKLVKTNDHGEPVFDENHRPVLYKADQEIEADPISSVIIRQNQLLPAVGKVCAHVVNEIESPVPRTGYTPQSDDILLHVREPALLKIEIVAGGNPSCGEKSIWKESVPVAQLGTEYTLPLPKPTVFGKRAFVAAFAESGSLQSVEFVSNTGAGQLVNVVSAAQTAAKLQTIAEKADAIKAEADLIAQQQRLTACLAKPADCK